MKQVNKISNLDAKKVYSKYLDCGKTIPPVYIDEYWDYYINIYDRKNHWETFLKVFQNDGLTYETFGEEHNNLANNVSKKIITVSLSDLVHKCRDIVKSLEANTDIPTIEKFDLSDSTYLQIDMHNAFDEALKYLGVYNSAYENTYAVINDSTKYESFHNQKRIRMGLYCGLFTPCFNDLYSIVDFLVNQIYKSEDPKLKEFTQTLPFVGKIHGDSYLYKLEGPVPPEIFDEYKCGDIGYHVNILESKTLNMLGQDYKCLISKNEHNEIERITLANKGIQVCPYMYPFLYKLIYNKELNEKDLAFGYDDQIFFHFDESEIYGTE